MSCSKSKNNEADTRHGRRGEIKFRGAARLKNSLFTKVFPDLRLISARLWPIFANFSIIRGLQPSSPLSSTPMIRGIIFKWSS